MQDDEDDTHDYQRKNEHEETRYNSLDEDEMYATAYSSGGRFSH